MAWTINICELRENRAMQFRGLNWKDTKYIARREYRVEYSDPTAGELVTDLTPYDALNAVDTTSGFAIPTVNRSTLFEQTQSLLYPYVVCVETTAVQNPDKLAHFNVTARFESDEFSPCGTAKEATSLQSDATNYPPCVEWKMGETQRSLFQDYTQNDPLDPDVNGPKRYLTPMGQFYDSPLNQRVPIWLIRITQYEDLTTYVNAYVQMRNRMLRFNEAAWSGYHPYSCLIDKCDAVEVTVPITTGTQDVFQVTYDIIFNDIADPMDALNVWGHRETRALISWTYFASLGDGKPLPYRDADSDTEMRCFITKEGLLKPGFLTDDEIQPDYEVFEQQQKTDYNTFLPQINV